MPTFKFEDEHGGTVEVSVKTTHRDVIADLAKSLHIEATTLPELRAHLRTCQRYMARTAASLIAHNDDPAHVTPAAYIDELSRLATETSTRPFGSSAGVKAEPPTFYPFHSGKVEPSRAPIFNAAGAFVHAEHAADYVAQEVSAQESQLLSDLGGTLGCEPNLTSISEQLRTWQRLTAQAVASLEQHNVDREYETPAEYIEELKKFSPPSHKPIAPGELALVYSFPFGMQCTFCGPLAPDDPKRTSLPRKPPQEALETVQRLVSAANSLEQGYKLKLASLWTALGRGPANRGGWREVLDAVAQLAAITSGVSSTSKAAHERQLLSQLWEAIGRTEGSRGSWADALESVQRLAAFKRTSDIHTTEHAKQRLSQLWQALGFADGCRGGWIDVLAHIRRTCKSKLDFELERIVVAVGEDLDAIGRVLEKPRHTIGRPAVNVETDEEYRARLITATEEKHA